MSFRKDIIPLFLLFILGDTITTIYALKTGQFYEGNPVLFAIFQTFGYGALIYLKLLFLILLYIVYKVANKYASRFYWNITRHSVLCIGILATLSNYMELVFHG